MHCQDLGWQNLWWKEALEPFVSFVDFLSQRPSGGKNRKTAQYQFKKVFYAYKGVCVCVLCVYVCSPRTINQPDYQG